MTWCRRWAWGRRPAWRFEGAEGAHAAPRCRQDVVAVPAAPGLARSAPLVSPHFSLLASSSRRCRQQDGSDAPELLHGGRDGGCSAPVRGRGGSGFIFSTVLEESRGWIQTFSGNWVWPVAAVAIKWSDTLPASLVPAPGSPRCWAGMLEALDAMGWSRRWQDKRGDAPSSIPGEA